MHNKITIALDGPAASGKSTTARVLAQKPGSIYIDAGAMYRAATLAWLQDKVAMDNQAEVESCVRKHQIAIRLDQGEQITVLDGTNVNHLIRTPEINREISQLASYGGVRMAMVELQRERAKAGGVVMDGRDIGTVVLPHAELKVFMIATLETRARRRWEELQVKGEMVSLSDVEEEIARRDKLDSGRSHSPLKKAHGARELDTSGLSIAQQVDTIYQWATELGAG